MIIPMVLLVAWASFLGWLFGRAARNEASHFSGRVNTPTNGGDPRGQP